TSKREDFQRVSASNPLSPASLFGYYRQTIEGAFVLREARQPPTGFCPYSIRPSDFPLCTEAKPVWFTAYRFKVIPPAVHFKRATFISNCRDKYLSRSAPALFLSARPKLTCVNLAWRCRWLVGWRHGSIVYKRLSSTLGIRLARITAGFLE